MNLVLARDYSDYQRWLDKQYRYVGDSNALDTIDPASVDKILFVGGFKDHPFYLSDELFEFQIAVARARRREG